MVSSQLDKIPANVVNIVREDERIRRLHTEALGRYNYLKQLIADRVAHAEVAKNDSAAGFLDETFEVQEKNAELHILSTDTTMLYYYFEQSTNSWLFLERHRTTGSSTMFTIQRKGKNDTPNVQVLTT